MSSGVHTDHHATSIVAIRAPAALTVGDRRANFSVARDRGVKSLRAAQSFRHPGARRRGGRRMATDQ